MARNSNLYAGLYYENIPFFADGKLYYINDDQPTADAGFHECIALNPIFPHNLYTINCRNVDDFHYEVEHDLMTAIVQRFGVYAYLQSVEDRSLLIPEPDYVQIIVHHTWETDGGTVGCLTPEEAGIIGGLTGNCPPNIDGTVHHEIGSSLTALPWGDPTVTGDNVQDKVIVGGESGGERNLYGIVRRIGGSEYTGDPTNEATDELIPWEEFITDPTVTFVTDALDVWRFRIETASAQVRLWFRRGAASTVLVEPGPSGWRRRGHVHGSILPPMTIG